MIAECYTADVYCDNEENCKAGMHCRTTHTFTGPNKRECDRQRVKAGWRKVRGLDICPVCIESFKKKEQPCSEQS